MAKIRMKPLHRALNAANRLLSSGARVAARPYRRNEETRQAWVEQRLSEVPAGWSLLDVGAGECQYKKFCGHLNYVSQDVAQYDGKGDGHGLQTGAWDFSRIDLVCDIYDIPEDRLYDAILCTEVLEHIPDAPAALRKFQKLLRPGGRLILTAPFACLVHFAPHFHSSGYSEYFYRAHLEALGFDIAELSPNGSYLRQVHNEVARVGHVAPDFLGRPLTPVQVAKLNEAALVLRELIDAEEAATPAGARVPSSELSCFGFHLIAHRRA
jgi:SAM-dependent methyltransferase